MDYTTHPGYDIIGVLATDWEWETDMKIKFRLRDNVWFQDGTPMTAASVKWNFERCEYFFNGTGDLPATSWEGMPSSLFFHSVTGEWLFKSYAANESDVWDDGEECMTFTMELNWGASQFISLLTFGAQAILSPTSTPETEYIDLATGTLVGTGPYKWIHFRRDREVRMERWERYWGTAGYFEVVIFRIIEDDTARTTAALAGQFDIAGIPSAQIDTFKADPDFHVEDIGEDLGYCYFTIYSGEKDYDGDDLTTTTNNVPYAEYQRNPPALRRALALATNYTYIWEEIYGGYSVAGTPCVPRAMPGYNASVVQAHDSDWEDNIPIAREYMMDLYPTETAALTTVMDGGTNDAAWQALTLKTLQVNRHFGHTANQRMNQLFADNFGLIGVKTEETIREWGDYLDVFDALIGVPWESDLGYICWSPDYINPFNMIDPLFNPQSSSNFCHLNDSSPGGLVEQLTAGGLELDLEAQYEYWKGIQSYIYDINRPLNPASHAHISGFVGLVQSIHKVGLIRDDYNVLSAWYIERWYYEE
ncbi:MAG: ABC transporter substrate-binding protein [Candidatus Lokiarchaeia archaeon]